MHFLKVLLILHITLVTPLQRLQAAVTVQERHTDAINWLCWVLSPANCLQGSSSVFRTEVLSNPATSVPIVQSVLSRIQLLNTETNPARAGRHQVFQSSHLQLLGKQIYPFS